MQLFALGLVAKHCFVSFLIECWVALGFSHDGLCEISACDLISGEHLRWISYLCQFVISACDFNDIRLHERFSLTSVAVEVLLQTYTYVLFIG